MQCQLPFVEMFPLAPFFSPLLLVSILEGCTVFLTCRVFCAWGRAWKLQGSRFLTGPPQLSGCRTVGISWGGVCGSGACLEEPQGPGDGLQGMFRASPSALADHQVLGVRSALTFWGQR